LMMGVDTLFDEGSIALLSRGEAVVWVRVRRASAVPPSGGGGSNLSCTLLGSRGLGAGTSTASGGGGAGRRVLEVGRGHKHEEVAQGGQQPANKRQRGTAARVSRGNGGC
jgi:hypothetical protein